MTRDHLEFAISQYLDGNLPPLEASALEERLAVDAQAREMLEEYRQLDRALKRAAVEPAVAWDRFASHLSQAISREEPPVKNYSLAGWRRAAGVALAACLALALAVAFLAYRGGAERDNNLVLNQGTQRPQPTAIVIGPQPERAPDRTAVAQVSIGPAPTMSDSWRYADTVVSRPAVVLIDRAHLPAQDTDASPF